MGLVVRDRLCSCCLKDVDLYKKLVFIKETVDRGAAVDMCWLEEYLKLPFREERQLCLHCFMENVRKKVDYDFVCRRCGTHTTLNTDFFIFNGHGICAACVPLNIQYELTPEWVLGKGKKWT